MNNTFAFSNAEEFKELFGMRKTQDGTLVRKNKIVLGFLKDYECHKYIRDNMPELWQRAFFRVEDVDSLYCYTTSCIRRTSAGKNNICLMGDCYASDNYKLDVMQGLCEDRDIRSIRYINCESGRTFKMKAGRFFKHLILNSEFGRHLPESTILYLCEEFSRRWETYARMKMPDSDGYQLVVNDDFESIYDSDECVGDFGSCMTDRGYDSFYNDAVEAKAASLRNADGKIVARCVIFTNVQDEDTGEVFRLAERQYATDGSELLKRLLVDALIRGGYIDGYKTVGASCHEGRNFVANDGTSMRDRHFFITCELEPGDTLSYQDSFKHYDIDSHVAHNSDCYSYTHELDTTEGTLEGRWDDYHDCWTNSDLVAVSYHGRWMECAEDDLEDFVYVSGEGYIHEDDVCYCDKCGEPYITEDGYYSELTDETYCCFSCRDRAEQAFKEDYWYYSEIDDEYYEDEDDVATLFVWDSWSNGYEANSISVNTLNRKMALGFAFEHNGEFYDTLEHLDTSATA